MAVNEHSENTLGGSRYLITFKASRERKSLGPFAIPKEDSTRLVILGGCRSFAPTETAIRMFSEKALQALIFLTHLKLLRREQP